MPIIENVTITKAANIYFDGNVTSRKIELSDGNVKTLGIMMPGDYEFSTEAAEVMEILAGKLKVMLPNSSEWLAIEGGQTFNVPANSTFKLNIQTLTDYYCSYES